MEKGWNSSKDYIMINDEKEGEKQSKYSCPFEYTIETHAKIIIFQYSVLILR